jgi:hypothetical protein
VKQLEKPGFAIKKLSVAVKDYDTDEQVVGYYTAGDRIEYRGSAPLSWGDSGFVLSGVQGVGDQFQLRSTKYCS